MNTQQGYISAAVVIVLIAGLLVGVAWYYEANKEDLTTVNTNVTENSNITSDTNAKTSKSCTQDSDCIHYICAGCFGEELPWIDLPCADFYNYICECIDNTCTEVKDESAECPEGQILGIYTDGSTIFRVCRDKPDDFGITCTSGTECEHDCMITEEAASALDCEAKQLERTSCPGVTGQCSGFGVQGIILNDGYISRTALY